MGINVSVLISNTHANLPTWAKNVIYKLGSDTPIVPAVLEAEVGVSTDTMENNLSRPYLKTKQKYPLQLISYILQIISVYQILIAVTKYSR